MKISAFSKTENVAARSTHWPLALVGVLALVLALGGCGGDDQEISADAGDDQEVGAEQGGEPDSDPDPDADADADADHQLTTSEPNMISARSTPISEVATVDAQTLAVRYRNGSEPCSLANVLVDETDSTITVSLETGLHPDVAAMSCIAQIIDYEIRVPLESPVGDREIIIDNP